MPTELEYPLKEEIPFKSPHEYFKCVADLPNAMFLDSSKKAKHLGRYSFFGFDPFLTISCKDNEVRLNNQKQPENLFDTLKILLDKYQQKTWANCPPFQGGAMGYLGYEIAQQLETLPLAQIDDLKFLDGVMALFDIVVGFDLVEERAWVFSSGFSPDYTVANQEHAEKRLSSTLQILLGDHHFKPSKATICKQDILSPFDAPSYASSVQKFIDYILAGDIFEGTMSQRFTAPMPDMSGFQLYDRLRQFNPAPFSAFLNIPNNIIASASPERFLQLTSGQVETRPIKGTIKRSANVNEDALLAKTLLESEKDWAENVMIVDLLRNDISKVCEPNSVKVPTLCGLESYETVHHLVSTIVGTLKPQFNAIDLLKATFPGGSITGAPKIRAMELIAELEPTVRGPYCGSIGYIGYNGDMDTSITIRTFAIRNETITFQVGGAITMDSEPHAEHEESLVKAQALIKTLTEAPK